MASIRSTSALSGGSSVHCLSMLIATGGNMAAMRGVTVPFSRPTSSRAASSPRSHWSTCGFVR